jgi:hypothetical protein
MNAVMKSSLAPLKTPEKFEVSLPISDKKPCQAALRGKPPSDIIAHRDGDFDPWTTLTLDPFILVLH